MTDAKSPLSYVIDVRRLPQKGFPVEVRPTGAERAALAAEHGLLSVDAFAADLLVRNWKGSGIIVTGSVRADIVQECIVTLEPLEAAIDEPVDAIFVPEGSPLARPDIADGEMFLDADGPDAPEIFNGESIDVGALAEEFFALAIDPYPRKPGAELPSGAGASADDSPFATLRQRLTRE